MGVAGWLVLGFTPGREQTRAHAFGPPDAGVPG